MTDVVPRSSCPVTAAEQHPEKIRRAVSVAAFMLFDSRSQDQTVPVAAQRTIDELLPGAEIHSLQSGHVSFLIRSRVLGDLLLAHS